MRLDLPPRLQIMQNLLSALSLFRLNSHGGYPVVDGRPDVIRYVKPLSLGWLAVVLRFQKNQPILWTITARAIAQEYV